MIVVPRITITGSIYDRLNIVARLSVKHVEQVCTQLDTKAIIGPKIKILGVVQIELRVCFRSVCTSRLRESYGVAAISVNAAIPGFPELT